MSEKDECPVCVSYTNSIHVALLEGAPCPHCGAPAALIKEIHELRTKVSDEKFRARFEQMAILESELRAGLDAAMRTIDEIAILVTDWRSRYDREQADQKVRATARERASDG